MRRAMFFCGIVGILGLVAHAMASQAGPPSSTGARAYEDAIKHLQFRSLGPANMDGRIDAFAVPRRHPNTIYVATATGGVWKSLNRGTTWEPIFDSQPVSSIGAIAVAPSDASIVWVGTGEANTRQTSSWGDGVYKSTDGGATWTNMGLGDSFQISRIVIHPTNPQAVYVAALGNLWGPGGQRGVYKTMEPAGTGRACSISTRTPESPTSRWTRRPLRRCLPPRTSAAERCTGSTAAVPAVRSTRPPPAAKPGKNCPGACRTDTAATRAESACRSIRAIRESCMPGSSSGRPALEGEAGCSEAWMGVRPGGRGAASTPGRRTSRRFSLPRRLDRSGRFKLHDRRLRRRRLYQP